MKKLATALMLAGCAMCAATPANAQVYYVDHYDTTVTTLARVNGVLQIVETVARILDPAPVVVVQQPAYYAPRVVYMPPPPPPVVVRPAPRPVIYRPAPPPPRLPAHFQPAPLPRAGVRR